MADDNRVYGGNPNFIHLNDGTRADFSKWLATRADLEMRVLYNGQRTNEELLTQPLCPGCCNVVVFDFAIEMAHKSGQSIKEMALTLANAFLELSENPSPQHIEEIEIVLDPCSDDVDPATEEHI